MFPATRVVINFDVSIAGELFAGESKNAGTRAGWILAGGRSSRMGRDKALIEIDGRPLVLRVAEAIRPVCGTVTLVGDPAKYAHIGLPIIPDLHPGQGPLGGIEAALAATAADRNLVVACDMPALDAASLESLFGTDADIAIAEHSNGVCEPLCAVYHRRCAATVRAAIESGVRKVIEFQRASGVTYVRVPRPEQFANLNTPADLTWAASKPPLS